MKAEPKGRIHRRLIPSNIANWLLGSRDEPWRNTESRILDVQTSLSLAQMMLADGLLAPRDEPPTGIRLSKVLAHDYREENVTGQSPWDDGYRKLDAQHIGQGWPFYLSSPKTTLIVHYLVYVSLLC